MFRSRRERKDSGCRFIYESLLREDFVQYAVVVTTDPEDGRIRRVLFNSFELGTTCIDSDGSIENHQWESETDIKSRPDGSRQRRYPAILGTSAGGEREFSERIAANVLAHMPLSDIAAQLRQFVDEPGRPIVFAKWRPAWRVPQMPGNPVRALLTGLLCAALCLLAFRLCSGAF